MTHEHEDPSLRRVRDALALHGLAEGIMTFAEDSTKTAQMACDAIGCELGQITKSLVFDASGTPVLALVAGDRRGDGEAIAREMGVARARLADPVTVRNATGYEVGGVSPFDLPGELPVLIDSSLRRYDTVYPAGGTSSAIVKLPLDTLVRLTAGRFADISG